MAGLGFELFYQANNTAFSSGALLRLYKITKKEIYKELSYLCLANVFKNVSLWDCNYGYGKNFPSFFALFPLSDAPYTAVYEEQEVFCAFHDYLHHAEGQEILPSLRLLLAEYIRYLVDRAVYYYPPMLPKEMLSEEVKTGEVDPSLWIALEDLHEKFDPDLLLIESGGDNLAANFSRELADFTIYVIDVAGGDKVPRKGGPGITQSDLLVINKTDLAPAVGADLDVMARDARKMRGDLPRTPRPAR